MLGAPIVLAGVAFFTVAIDFTLSLNALRSADSQAAIIEIGGAEIPAATAVFLQDLFLVVGVALIVIGLIVGFLGRKPTG